MPPCQLMVLLALAFAAGVVRPTNNLSGFILAIAALNLGWAFVVPWIETSATFHSFFGDLSWGGRFFLSRLLRVIGAFLVLITFIGSGLNHRDLFLRIGDWKAPVQSTLFFRFRRPISWTRFTALLLLIFEIVLPLFLLYTLHPQASRIDRLLLALPWALATSALNAANEEFQFRSVLLARLKNIVSPQQAILLVAVFFGTSHYFGQPSGWGGVILAGIAGWIWAKSMLETAGFTCAFLMHFVQDVVIFAFIAISGANYPQG